jgi:hypothetical protein
LKFDLFVKYTFIEKDFLKAKVSKRWPTFLNRKGKYLAPKILEGKKIL